MVVVSKLVRVLLTAYSFSQDRAKQAALAKAKAEQAATASSGSSASATSNTNVDKLVEDLLVAPAPKLVREAGVSYETSPSDGGTAAPSSASQPQLSTIASVSLEERLKSLSISNQVTEIHIVSQAAESYTKGTQTDGDPEWKVQVEQAPDSPTHRTDRAGSATSQPDFDDDAVEDGGGDADEGGDDEEEKQAPKELSPDEIDSIMKGRPFEDFFQRTVRVTERAVLANAKFDVLVEYGDTTSGVQDDGGEKMSHLFDFTSQRWCTGRSVTQLAWSPNNAELLLGCYSAPSGATDTDWSSNSDPDGLLLVWNMMNQAAPEYVFTAQSPVLSGLFHPFSPNLLVGSTYSGQICLWDIRARRSAIQKTELSAKGHTHPVYAMHVVGAQNAHSLVTISTNGKLCTWDTTQLVTPTESLHLNIEPNDATLIENTAKNAQNEVACTSCAFSHGETNSFIVGAENGSLYDILRHGSQPGVQQAHNAHHALVSSSQFHPMTDVRGTFSDVLLTSSFDWSLKLWNFKRSKDKPLHTFSAASDYVFDAKWSPVHPSLLASGDAAGNIDLWDLCKDMEVPIHRVEDNAKSAISSVVWSNAGDKLGAGFSDGRIAMFDVSAGVAQPGPKAHTAFSELLAELPYEDVSAEAGADIEANYAESAEY